MSDNWQHLGAVAPGELVDARLQLHYAAQVVSGIGRTLLTKKDDDSHSNLEWLREPGGLASHPTESAPSFRAAIDFGPFHLLLLDRGGQSLQELPLEGRTLDQAYAWLASALDAHGGPPIPEGGFVPIHYELPAHPIGQGEPFHAERREALEELERWYHNAYFALSDVQALNADASPVRTWPHHFDMATLIELDRGREVKQPRTIGVGLSPGDETYPEPYWYVTPYPYPRDPKPPALPAGGRWHTEGFVAAILPGSELVQHDEQAEALQQFFEAGLEVCRRLLKGPPS